MNINEFQAQISLGEDSTRQFKADIRNAESLASELAAFANSEGGTIYLGVADDGGTPGLDKADVARINQLISNAASHLVKSPLTVRTENISLDNGRVVILLTVPNGLDKPYFDKNGVIWLKSGADKRRVNSKEELDLVNISSDSSPNTDVASGKSRENVGKTSGKRRESVGKDSGYLQGKAFCYHPGVSFTDWHYRAIGTAKYSETAARRIAAPNWRVKGRPLGSFVIIRFSEGNTEKLLLGV
ncbi:AlbA family DNA-binding domain-containing protein [Desulfonatronovibrio magnus]|uniref:AlbA family DNA-binding domain-containing protein n=1 Tax=Desulfonatronovibrio magnus TaxID=698827 RepID=UPI000696C182|nr:ATP-binding protein [Desulfonatronovibrio magnus]